jgi:hypothetical protein
MSSSRLVSTIIGSSMFCSACVPEDLVLLLAKMEVGDMGLASEDRIPLKNMGLLLETHNRSRRSMAISSIRGLLDRFLRAPITTPPWLGRCETSV